MSKPLNPDLLLHRYEKMLAYQEKIKPFTPTIKELCEVWGLHTTSSVHIVLRRLEKDGRVVSRLRGPIKHYYAIRPGS